MAKDFEDPKPRGSFRWGRIVFTLIFLVVTGAVLYGASWLNASRYFLIVGPNEVSVAKGRMLPMGHEPFVPQEVELRRAYESFLLPSGINVPRGETRFSDRIELDQALFRLLKDCIAFALSRDDRTTPPLVAKYLTQIHAIPGTSVSQQLDLQQLERDAAYVSAKHKVEESIGALKEAAKLFKDSMKGTGVPVGDGEARARRIQAAIDVLEAKEGARPEETRSRDTSAKTANTATSTATTTR